MSMMKLFFRRDPHLKVLTRGRGREKPLLPPRRMLKGVDVEVSSFQERAVVSLTPREGEGAGRREGEILFLHGGAYLLPATPFHWELMADLAKRTGLKALFVDYPLAPEHHSGEALNFVLDFYHHRYGARMPQERKGPLFLVGDSAGGGLALALLMALRVTGRAPLPQKCFLVSPYLDAGCTDPRQREYEAVDPLLTVEGLRRAGRIYAGSLSLEDWRISPLFGDLSGLCPLSLYTSTADILHPDALRLKERLEAAGLPYSYHCQEDLLHEWLLFSFLPEGLAARERLAGEMKD